MALLRWGGAPDVPPGAVAFDYHRHLAPMCSVLLALQVIEISVVHLLVVQWSVTAALMLAFLGLGALISMVGLIKSFRYRPVLVAAEGVRVRTGILIDRLVPFAAIERLVTEFDGDAVRAPTTLNAGLLGWPNVMLRLREPLPRTGLRRRPPIAAVAFRLDDPAPFVRMVAARLAQG
jgi:hypothetical protein